MSAVREVFPYLMSNSTLPSSSPPLSAHYCPLTMLHFLQSTYFYLPHYILLWYCLSSPTRKEYKLPAAPVSVNGGFFLFHTVHYYLSCACGNYKKNLNVLMDGKY